MRLIDVWTKFTDKSTIYVIVGRGESLHTPMHPFETPLNIYSTFTFLNVLCTHTRKHLHVFQCLRMCALRIHLANVFVWGTSRKNRVLFFFFRFHSYEFYLICLYKFCYYTRNEFTRYSNGKRIIVIARSFLSPRLTTIRPIVLFIFSSPRLLRSRRVHITRGEFVFVLFFFPNVCLRRPSPPFSLNIVLYTHSMTRHLVNRVHLLYRLYKWTFFFLHRHTACLL